MSISLIEQGSCSYQIDRTKVFIPESMEKVEGIVFQRGVFSVIENGKSSAIYPYDVRGLPKHINDKQLAAFLQGGFLHLSKMENGDIVIRAQTCGLGGSGKGAGKGAGRGAAHHNTNKALGSTVGGMAAGAAAGAAIGGMVAGPPGAVVGGLYGAGVGGAASVAASKRNNK